MSDFDISFVQRLATVSYIEVLARGPEKVNRLVIVSGMCYCDLSSDTGEFTQDSNREPDADVAESYSPHPQPGSDKGSPRGNVLIKTSYILDKSDQWIGIVRNNTSLKQTTYACLASINTEAENEFLYAIDAASADIEPVKPRSINHPDENENELVVRLQVGLAGMATLTKIYYQVHLLLQK